MKRGLVIATSALEPVRTLASTAERAGFDRIWTTEYVGRDAIARALAAALATTRIRVGTGVAYAFTRSTLAMAALGSDVARLSAGRFDLGLSPGSRGVRRWYGAQFEPPGSSLVAYFDDLRDIWSRDEEYAAPRLYAPALNPRFATRLSGVADGLLVHPLALGHVHSTERLLPAIAAGTANRRSGPPELVAWQIVSVSDDEGLARERAAAQIAFYLSTPSYAGVLAGTQWEHVANEVRAAFERSPEPAAWLEIAKVVPDDVVDEFSIAGNPFVVRAGLARAEKRLSDHGFAEIALQSVGAGLSDHEATAHVDHLIRALAPANNSVSERTRE